MLKPQLVNLPLTGGLDESANTEADEAGIRLLENWDHVEGGAIQRRNGFTRVGATVQRGTRGLVASDNSLAIIQANYAEGFIPGAAAVHGVLGGHSSLHKTVTTSWDGHRVRMGDSCVLTQSGRSYIFAVSLTVDEAFNTTWGTANATTIYYRVLDYATGQTMFSGSVAGTSPRCAVSGDGTKFLLFYLTPGYATTVSLNMRAIDPSTLTAAGDVTVSAVATSAAQRHAIDAFTWDGNGRTYVAYTDTTPNLRVSQINSAGTSVLVTLDDTASLANGQSVGITVNDNGLVVAVYVGTATHCHASVYDSGLIARTRGTEGGTPVISGTSLTLRSCGVVKLTGSNTVYVVVESFVASDVRVSSYDASGVGGVTVSTGIPQSVLVTKPFEVGGSTTESFRAVGVTAVNAITSGYRNVLLVRLFSAANTVVGQLAFDECGVVDAGNGLASVAPVPYAAGNPRIFSVAVPVTEEGVDAVSGAPQVCRLRVTELNWGPGALITARNRGLGYIAGSTPQVWDGSQLFPMAFYSAPSTPTGGTGGTSLWSYRLVLEYSDSKGNIQTSPPSGVMTSDATATTNAVLKYPPTMSNINGFTVRAKLYRTAAGGALFYLARQWTIPVGTVTETVSDSLTDTALLAGEALYTTGNALESELNPPLAHMCSHKNRLFGLRADDTRTVAFTQELTDPFFPRWHSALTIRVDNDGGNPTAVASMDDKLLVFQANQIVAFAGDGPDGLGAGSFSTPEVVARGVGVDDDNRASVVSVPDGVMFRHSSGLYLLNRALQVIPVGLAVRRSLGTTTVTRARFLPSRHQAWFMLAGSATVLVFDTKFGRWSTYVGPWTVAYDAVEVAGTVYVLDANATDGSACYLFQLDTASYVDKADGSTPTYFTQTIKRPWFRAQRSEAQRLWRAGLSGEVVNGTGISVTLDAFSQRPGIKTAKNAETRDARFTWTAAQIGALPAGGFERWAKIVTQRCGAFRCDITITPTNTDSVGLKLTHVGYEFGILPTEGKMPAAAKPAAS